MGTATTRDIVLPLPDAIPLELRQLPQWVGWVWKRDGKSKLPVDPKTGREAKVNDHTTWSDFRTAYRFAQNRRCGIGFVFTEQDPYTGIDFDECRSKGTGAIKDEAKRQIKMLASCSEVSPSGTGVKVIVKARLERNRKKPGVEVYDRGRFFTITGEHVTGTPTTIEERQAEADALVREVFGNDGHRAEAIGDTIPFGTQHNTLVSLAGTMRRRGMGVEEINAALQVINETRLERPAPPENIRKIAESVCGLYPPEAPPDETLQRDYGHAATLATLFKNRYRWAVHRGSWMQYQHGVWRPVPDELVAKEAADTLRLQYATQLAATADKTTVLDLTKKVAETCTYARITGALSFLKGWDGILTLAEEWDKDPWLLNVRNGTLDLRTCTLRQHDPGDLLTKQANVEYDPNAKGEKWEQHIQMFLPDIEVRREVQRDLGLCLVGASLAELLPIWYGTGANGKSTTLRAIMHVLGDYAQMAAPRLLMATRCERHSTELAELQGRRLVFSAETGEGGQMDEERVKWLTGGENIRAHFMRQDNVEFKRSWVITLVTNYRPEIRGTDNGIWRRVRLIPWTVSLPREQQRPQELVLAELAAEGSAILHWLAEGFRDWLNDPGWLAGAVEAATNAYRQDQDILAGFLSDCCEFGPRFRVPAGELYQVYVSWCEASAQEPVKKTTFGKRLSVHGVSSGRDTDAKGTRIWRGLRLLTRSDTFSVSPHENENSPEEPENTSERVRNPNDSIETLAEGRCNFCGTIVGPFERGCIDGKLYCRACAGGGGEHDAEGEPF